MINADAISRIRWRGIIIGLLVTLASFFFGGISWGEASLLGGAIAWGSFELLVIIARRLLGLRRHGAIAVGSAAMLKLLLLGGILWYVTQTSSLEPLAFLGGLSCIVAAIFLETLKGNIS